MKLLTKEILAKLPALYSQEAVKDPLVVVKFFQPWGSWTWYATEGGAVCPEHGFCDCTECPKPWPDFMFFGLVDGHEKEMGYFQLSELAAISGPGGLRIERDLYWKPKPLSQVRAS